jgi:hemerythrin-like domain-containing protein
MARKTTRSKSRSKSPAKRSSGRRQDAIALLKSDHDEVKKLFQQFESKHDKMSSEDKQALAEQICAELKVHTSIEEEIFYPAVGEHVEKAEELLHEAKVEHDAAKTLIKEIESGDPDDELWDAKVTVLGEYVLHHVKEEQNELFPMVRKAKEIDLRELAERLMARKQELMREQGLSGGRGRMQEQHASMRA